MIEYSTVPTYGLALGGAVLEQMGKDGWQLVTIEHGMAYFSRVAQPTQPEAPKPTRRKKTTGNK